MKKLFTIVLLITSCQVIAQQDSLKVFNANRVRITSTGMEVLGSWGIANLGGGLVGWNVQASHEMRYFFQMNTAWGAVDFATALLGYSGTQKNKKKPLTAAETIKEQDRIQKIFFVNGCLDVAYIGTGLYLKLNGDSRNSPMMRGYGESLLMQGGFLLIFDGLMYQSEKANGGKLHQFLEKHPVTFDGRRVGIIFRM
ncbi:MAG TPA: hypothetical protein VHB54_02980 [Mucilaginibacter sp.]|nr:hypothetical protein [Mucilaginibacter sp.]